MRVLEPKNEKVGINSHFLLASNKFVRRGGEDQEDSIMS